MKPKKLLPNIYNLVLWLPLSAIAGTSTLCDSDQKVYFSCRTTNNKIISVCDSQYSQYRYGTKSHIEFAFPRNKLEANAENAVIYGSNENNGFLPETIEIHFRTGKYRYTVFNHASRSKIDGKFLVSDAGVVVVKVGREGHWQDVTLNHAQCVTTDINFIGMPRFRAK